MPPASRPSRDGGVPSLPELPVSEALPRVRAALDAAGSAVLVAPPGAGKTTLVPLDLLDAGVIGAPKIVMLEPRRLAARAAAARMSALLREKGPGGTVGYRTRLDTRVGDRTRIEVVTEGILPRMIQSDPALEGVGLVVLDEFHERSLPADLGLALVLHSRDVLRPDLRILVMSATLEAAPVADLLGGAPIVESPGRAFPVETRLRGGPVKGRMEAAVARTVLRSLEEEEGDVLAFLPGAREIRWTARRLEAAGLPPSVDLRPLFGNLPPGEQDRAIAPSPSGRRKVVLGTAIAETSLTIEGVRVVVDAGWMRVPRFDPGTGMTRLDTVRVTRDAADQRRGRAGRTAPGVCFRLWSRGEDRGLIPRRSPEIREADLAGPALELAVWGAGWDELRWLDPPPEAARARGQELLRELGAVNDAGSATGHGRAMAELGAHPRLGHMLLRAREMGMGAVACDLAALLGERDILRGEGEPPDPDLRLRLEVLRRSRRGGGRPGSVAGVTVERAGLGRVLAEAGRWRRRLGIAAGEEGRDEDAGVVASLAYPDRIGRARGRDSVGGRPGGAGGVPVETGGRFLLTNGTGARLPGAGALSRAGWIVAAEVRQGRGGGAHPGGGRTGARPGGRAGGTGRPALGGADALVLRAAPLESQEVEAHHGSRITEVDEVIWDADAGRVRARRRSTLGAIVVREAALRDPEPARMASVLLDGIRETGLEALPWDRECRRLRERLHFLHHLEPDRWPDFSWEALEASLDSWLLPFLSGMRSLDEVGKVELREVLLARVGWERRREVDRLAPPTLAVPSGSTIALDYSDPDAPALAVRIQEVFGWTETPRVGGGRVPVTMKLLSPARRPTQVTTDLASFWRDAYFEVKKDLQGRYPKHFWPDDPLTAPAARGTRPPR